MFHDGDTLIPTQGDTMNQVFSAPSDGEVSLVL